MPDHPTPEFTVDTDLFGELRPASGAAVDEIAVLTAYARAIAGRSKAANTKRAYRAHWNAYTRYCERLGFAPLSGDPQVVGLFLAALHRDGKRLSTIRATLAAISTAHRLAGLALDLRHRAIATVLEGLKRELGVRPVKEAPPLLDTALRPFLAAFGPDAPRARRNRALVLVGFGAALRRSEIVALDLEDITLTTEGLTVLLRRSKTDQYGAGAMLAIYRAAAPDLCVVNALERWLAVRSRASGPLFTRVLKSGRVTLDRLSERAVWDIIRQASTALGWQDHGLSPHSLRAGLATSAALKGAPLDEIMEQTRHRSYAVARKYVRNADAWKRNVTQRIFRQA